MKEIKCSNLKMLLNMEMLQHQYSCKRKPPPSEPFIHESVFTRKKKAYCCFDFVAFLNACFCSQTRYVMKKAFTLVEILVVVVIIALLATIMTFSVRDALIRARFAASINNIKVLANGIEMLKLDKGVFLVDMGDGNEEYGRDRIRNVFHGVGLGNPRQGRNYLDIFAPLTSPISYVNQIPKDPFITEILINQHYETRDYYPKRDEYLYFTSCDYPHLWDSWCDSWSPPGGAYQIEGCGPVRHPGGNCNWYLTKYDPTNGLHSNGSIYYSSYRGFLL